MSLKKLQIKIDEETVFLLFCDEYVEKLLTAGNLNILFTFSHILFHFFFSELPIAVFTDTKITLNTM